LDGEDMSGLSFIGLGLHDETDMSLRALDEAKGCDILYAEFYTSAHAGMNIERIEKLVGKKVEVLKREDVEEGDLLIEKSRTHNVGFLVPGDPMMATTHIELRMRAEKEGIPTRLVHGASIFSAAAGLLGLQPYKFGRATTIPERKKGYEPRSPYDVIKANKEQGLHTLVLLDIIEEEGKTLTARYALEYLLKIEEREKCNVITGDTLVCVVGDAGGSDPYVRADRIQVIMDEGIDKMAQTMVVPGKLHFMEAEALVALAHASEVLLEELK
jgi:diphthine synthase